MPWREGFFRLAKRIVRHVRQHCRREEKSGTAAHDFAAAVQARSARDRVGDVRRGLVQRGFIDQGPDVNLRLQPIAHLQCAGAPHKRVDEPVVQSPLHVNAVRRDAGLPGVPEFGNRYPLDDFRFALSERLSVLGSDHSRDLVCALFDVGRDTLQDFTPRFGRLFPPRRPGAGRRFQRRRQTPARSVRLMCANASPVAGFTTGKVSVPATNSPFRNSGCVFMD